MSDRRETLIITPPFTQLNAPYAAAPFLAGTLTHHGHAVRQCDLGIRTALRLFSPDGLARLFALIAGKKLTDEQERLCDLAPRYGATIGEVIAFLQGRNPGLAQRIVTRRYLPEGPRFAVLDDGAVEFDTLDLHDQALYLATLYLDDIADLAAATALPGFGLARYHERLAQSPATFDELYRTATGPGDLVTDLMMQELAALDLSAVGTALVTIPFPGALIGALRVGRYIKEKGITVIFGGGYVNTELRELADPRFFEFCDFVTLDNGEAPVLAILDGKPLLRTFRLVDGKVVYEAGEVSDLFGEELGAPTYDTAELARYLDLIETSNPMHRLWSARGTLKIRLTHGCYWHKCAFCDTGLDYIGRYRPLPTALIVEQMERLVRETGMNTFHLVDESLPPAVLRELSIEILRRGLAVSWWGNIRFEKGFNADLCRLMAAAGCIAVTGGLEGVTPKMMELMQKGVTQEEAICAIGRLSDAGIMIHAYLIYGFPGQTVPDLIDGLEIVRQLFFHELIQSGYFHRFALTVHSPVFAEQERYGIVSHRRHNKFANNDVSYTEKVPHDLEALGPGLKKAIYNYLHGMQWDAELRTFFDVPVPAPALSPHAVTRMLKKQPKEKDPHGRILWLGALPERLGKGAEGTIIRLTGLTDAVRWELPTPLADWLIATLTRTSVLAAAGDPLTFAQLRTSFPQNAGGFGDFMHSEFFDDLTTLGLLIV